MVCVPTELIKNLPSYRLLNFFFISWKVGFLQLRSCDLITMTSNFASLVFKIDTQIQWLNYSDVTNCRWYSHGCRPKYFVIRQKTIDNNFFSIHFPYSLRFFTCFAQEKVIIGTVGIELRISGMHPRVTVHT